MLHFCNSGGGVEIMVVISCLKSFLPSICGKDIPRTAGGFEVDGLFGVGFDFAAQPGDLHIN